MPLDLARLEAAAASIGASAAESDRAYSLPAASVAELAATRVFKCLVPKEHGGAQTGIVGFATALEAVARIDGSAGWIAMIGATAGLASAWMPEALASAAFDAPDAFACGVFAPTGRCVREGSTARVRGRWSYASGCEHAQWCMVGVVMHNAAGPVVLPSGVPDVRMVLLRSGEWRVDRTWDALGLRGTGSHDVVVDDVAVPISRCFSLYDLARHPAPVYRMSPFGVLAVGVCAVAVGVAASAVERFVALARDKTPAGARRSLAHRELVQYAVAIADARVRAGGLLLHDAARRAEADPSQEHRAELRLAACHVARESVAAVDLLCNAAGAGAMRAGEALERKFRDVHMAAQHAMVADAVTVLAGRVRLGLDIDATSL